MAEDADAGFKSYIIALWHKRDVECCTHTEYGFEYATFGDRNIVSPAVQSVGFYFITFILKLPLDARCHHRDEGSCPI